MLVESFIKYIRYELNYSTCTVLSYSSDLKQFVDFLTADTELFDAESVTVNDVRAWMAKLMADGCSVTTVKRKLQSLRAFYKYLMRVGKVQKNPAREVEMAKVPHRLPECVKVENMEQMFSEQVDYDAFEEVRDRLIMLMMYSTGIRRSELINLRDADVADGELKVHGKRNKDRMVPFGDELQAEIAIYRELRNREVGETEWLFVRSNGEQLYPTMVYRLANKKLGDVGGCSRRSPHVLRHTFASSMLNNGAKLNSVKELLGHESLAATQVYTHITYRELKSNYEHAHPRALKKGG